MLFSNKEIVDLGIRIKSGLGGTFSFGLVYILKYIFYRLFGYDFVFDFIQAISILIGPKGVKWVRQFYTLLLVYLCLSDSLDTTWTVTIDAIKAILPSFKMCFLVNAIYVLSIRLSKYLDYNHIYFNRIIFQTVELYLKHLFRITLNNANFRYWSDIFYITIVCIILFFNTNYPLYWLYLRLDLLSDFSIYSVVTILLVNTIVFIVIICVFIINSKDTK